MKKLAMLGAGLICVLWGNLIFTQGALAEDSGAMAEPIQAMWVNGSELPEPGSGCDPAPQITAQDALIQWLHQWWNKVAGGAQAIGEAPADRGRPPATDGGEEGFDTFIRQ